jgi:2-amino-4-hydroxy-6-hydroxymethyldihydropteridine diphosphokinase
VSASAVAILSLGSNLGDRERTIRDAIADLAAVPGVRVLATSGLVETAAVKTTGVDVSAPAYLNAIAQVETSLSPEALLAATSAIETGRGRVRTERWGDRTLDIDIVTFGELQQNDEALTIPHPRAAERAFVLVPWLQVDPNATLPGIGRVDGLPEAAAVVRRYPAEALS